MAASIQLKRGATAKVAAYTPLSGEMVLDTTTNKLYVGDGSTAGGNAPAVGSADKLSTARTIQTNLASTSSASFDGSAAVTPGVTGILALANGGTGVQTLSALSTAMGFAYSSNRIAIPVGSTKLYLVAVSAVVTASSSGTATISFPAAFSTICLAVIPVNGDDSSTTVNGNIKLTSFTPTGNLSSFTVYVVGSTGGSVRVNYIAIGY